MEVDDVEVRMMRSRGRKMMMWRMMMWRRRKMTSVQHSSDSPF